MNVNIISFGCSLWLSAGLSNLSAMAGRIDFILGMAGQYAISATIKAMFECDFLNVLIWITYEGRRSHRIIGGQKKTRGLSFYHAMFL